MARIPLLSEHDPAIPAPTRAVLERIETRRGAMFNVYRLLAHRPRIAELIAELYSVALEGTVAAADCELAYLATSVANRCEYCTRTHARAGHRVGLTDEQIAHVGDEPPPAGVYTPAQLALIRYARRATIAPTIDDETYAELARHWNVDQQIDLWALVGLANMTNRLHATFHTDLDRPA